MDDRDRRVRWRVLVASVLGLGWVLAAGPQVAVPALALVALVQVASRLVAAARGEAAVAHPDLAFVIVANALVVLFVQLLLVLEGSA